MSNPAIRYYIVVEFPIQRIDDKKFRFEDPRVSDQLFIGDSESAMSQMTQFVETRMNEALNSISSRERKTQ